MCKVVLAISCALITGMLTGPAFAAGNQFSYQGHDYIYEAVPTFDQCGDHSLEQAQKQGITLGISPDPPYSSIDPQTKEAGGIDVDINRAVLGWLGITTVHYQVMPFGQLIPALLAHRVDIIAANIHYTPDRVKVIDFTGPSWWYGPAIVTHKGNPDHLTSYDMLKGKQVGAIVGSAADEYLRKLGANVTPFQTSAEEFAAISTGRVPALVEDDVKVIAYLKANPDSPIEIVPNVAVPEELIYKYGYGYARYATRKDDCTLRAGYTEGLSESRANGAVSAILKHYGLSNRNLLFFPLQ
ncbi:MAG TPA: ABC transporter substrate-binding protein [Acetobacteraceae bacterium]|nr:ABC transporter substrate-binding protein [Acetobacteraceae bacterium]